MSKLRACAALLTCLLVAGTVYAQQAQQEQKRATVGKLGQMNKAAPVYVKPDRRSRTLYKVEAERYVVLRNLTDDWATLVMADGTSGYVEAKYVDRLPYDVNVRNNAPASGNGAGASIVRAAMQYLGTPYKWGGNDLLRGVDCSGFVQQLFLKAGIRLPRTAEQQGKVGAAISRLDQLQPGDRLYFVNSERTKVSHTGIYVGNGYFIHSSGSRRGVTTDYLTGKWTRLLVGVRR